MNVTSSSVTHVALLAHLKLIWRAHTIHLRIDLSEKLGLSPFLYSGRGTEVYLPSNGFFCATRSQKIHEIIGKLLKTGLRHSTRTKLCPKKTPSIYLLLLGRKRYGRIFYQVAIAGMV